MALSSSLDIIETKITDTRIQEKIWNMQKTLRHMNELIDELLFLARKTSRKESENISLEKFLWTYIEEQFLPLATEKGVKIKLINESDFEIQTNRLYLQKVLWNLIKNAIHYTAEKWEIVITIEKNKVTIRDTGCGMGQEELSHIWDRFYRIDTSRSKGTIPWYGLWLAIVKKVISEQKWKIEVSSKLWEGTIFAVTFK
jgi:signal transduction histidine kinase